MKTFLWVVWALVLGYVSATPAGFCYYGPTPLVAACRARVASELGGEVDVPDFLE